MLKQKGFTLIELMVVMAIIAILATAGITSYGGYIKKARDSTRISDMSALEAVAISSFDASGQAVDFDTFKAAVKAMNNDTLLTDPMDNTSVCLPATVGNTPMLCEYIYGVCVNGGYVLKTRFESTSNHHYYTEDKINEDYDGRNLSYYEVGNCDEAAIEDTIR